MRHKPPCDRFEFGLPAALECIPRFLLWQPKLLRRLRYSFSRTRTGHAGRMKQEADRVLYNVKLPR
jgi:hypothetical protein